ncbi:MAG: hypothetical protein AAFW95_05710 [Cyanobacteria bacterium J06638_6]
MSFVKDLNFSPNLRCIGENWRPTTGRTARQPTYNQRQIGWNILDRPLERSL